MGLHTLHGTITPGGILANAALAEQDFGISNELMKNVQATLLSYPAKAPSLPPVYSAPAKASAPFWDGMPGKGTGKADGEGKSAEGKGNASKPETEASKFNSQGQIASAPAFKGQGKGPPKEFKPRKPKPKGPPPMTPSTITLHGPGFDRGREDVVLEACQDVAFMEGFSWPDYAYVVHESLCHVEWPSRELATTFLTATEHKLEIGDKTFTVRLPSATKAAATETGVGVDLLEGARVQIQNLTGAKELNGKFAKVDRFNESTGRYIVILEEDAKVQKSLKPDNLKSVSAAQAAASSKAAPAKPSVVASYVEGTRVVIGDLTGKDLFRLGAVDMNGKVAIVKSFDKEKGEYMVELEEQAGIPYKLKPGNITPLDSGMTELERRKKRALGGGNNDMADALKGVNGDMWANFANMFGNEPEQKKPKPEE